MTEPLPGPYEVVADVPGRLLIYSHDGWRIATGIADHASGDRVAHRATVHLLAAAWELCAALTAIEWGRHGIVHGEVQPICAVCDAAQAEGHVAGCLVDTALRKAGGGSPAGR